MSKSDTFKLLKDLIPLAFITTSLYAALYLSVQQNYRLSANDPQVQLSRDGVAILSKDANPQALISNVIDPSISLAPFIIVYDDTGKVIASGAQINNQTPTLPQGVLNEVKEEGEQRLTWQPQSNTRIAAVVNHYSGSSSGYVLSGRSLKLIEEREEQLLLRIGILWSATLIGLISLLAVLNILKRRFK